MTYAIESVDWLTSARTAAKFDDVSLSLTSARQALSLESIDVNLTQRALPILAGYIAGTGSGIVTLNNVPARCEVLCMPSDSKDYRWTSRTVSTSKGNYLFDELDPNKSYMVLARDPNKQYEPAVWDYVTPATDLTIAEQQELWQSWQTSP